MNDKLIKYRFKMSVNKYKLIPNKKNNIVNTQSAQSHPKQTTWPNKKTFNKLSKYTSRNYANL